MKQLLHKVGHNFKMKGTWSTHISHNSYSGEKGYDVLAPQGVFTPGYGIKFLRNFRLNKDSANELAEILHEDLVFANERGRPLTPLQQLCLTLSFLANGSFMYVAGEVIGVKKTCAFKTLHNTVQVICNKLNYFITLPTPMEMRRTADDLFWKIQNP